MMNQTTVQKKVYLTLATISIVMLLSAAVVVPSWSAFADHDKGNGKSQDDKKDHKKDRKGDDTKDPQRCLHGSSAKYNKHCD